jgi:hypothetical protein
MTARDGSLTSIRRVDWRFLLPGSAFETVALVGEPDGAVQAGLEQVAGRVVGRPEHGFSGDDAAPTLVVTIGASGTVLQEALGLVPAGAWIYAGAGPPGAPGRAMLREVAAALRAAGFGEIRRSWHWPTEPAALEIVSLDDPRAVRLTLGRRRSGRAARMKAAVAGVALRLHLLEWIVPGWSVIGRRPTGGGAGSVEAVVDPVLASASDGGTAAGAGVVLLTPRFLASRHVIGLLVRPAGDGLTAVVKMARFPDDDGGIRREAEALRQAAELGVSGVPEVRAFRGAPEPVLVESPLDGVVIAGRELRARPVGAISEVEAWTRELAGGPGRREVPLRILWAPALERVAAGLEPATSSMSVAVAQLGERTATILGGLEHTTVPTVLEHGDLAPPNLLRLRDGRLGVVDWEVADLEGLPLGDLLFFAAFVVGEPAADGAPSAPAMLPPAIGSVVERQAAYLGIETGLIPALRLAMWARWADRQLARFVDRAIPLEDRLPARHLRSWTAAVDETKARG